MTVEYGLFYQKGSGGSFQVLGYSDSDLAGDVDDSKCTSGMVFFLDDNQAAWSSQKQRVVALSSCEAEYIVGARLLEELLGLKMAAPRIRLDNQSAIALSKNPMLLDRSKHIKTKYHFIRECVVLGEISLEFVGTQDQLADLLMKPLARVKFQELRRRIRVIKLSSFKALS
jgi:hypothetical protein